MHGIPLNLQMNLERINIFIELSYSMQELYVFKSSTSYSDVDPGFKGSAVNLQSSENFFYFCYFVTCWSLCYKVE